MGNKYRNRGQDHKQYGFEKELNVVDLSCGNTARDYFCYNSEEHSVMESCYSIEYDEYGREVCIKENNQVLISKEYKVDGLTLLPTYLVSKIKFANKDEYLYEYDELDRLSKVYYKKQS